MTLTNEQWTENLQASEDPDSLYPDAPRYDLPEGAQADYEVDDDEYYDDDGDGEPSMTTPIPSRTAIPDKTAIRAHRRIW